MCRKGSCFQKRVKSPHGEWSTPQIYPLSYQGISLFRMDLENNWNTSAKGYACLFMGKGLKGKEKKGLKDSFSLYLD